MWPVAFGLVAVAVGAAVVAVLVTSADGGRLRRGGLIEVTFTTADRSEQTAVSRACGQDRRSQLTDTTVRYSFAPERQESWADR